jgi:hypothetical protein
MHVGVQFNQNLFAKELVSASGKSIPGTRVPETSLPDLTQKLTHLKPQLVRIFFSPQQDKGSKSTPGTRDSFIKTAELAQAVGATINVTVQSVAGYTASQESRGQLMIDFASILDELVQSHGITSLRWVTLQAAAVRHAGGRRFREAANVDLLALQCAAGNGAVGQLLRGRRDGAPARTAAEYGRAVPDEDRTRLTGARQRSARGRKSGIDSLSDMAIDDVNVRYDLPRPAQLDALAYAKGANIEVAPGQEQDLPHEAWHVVQQPQGRATPTTQLKSGVPVNDDQGLEREADLMGAETLESSAQLQGFHQRQPRPRFARPDTVASAGATVQRIEIVRAGQTIRKARGKDAVKKIIDTRTLDEKERAQLVTDLTGKNDELLHEIQEEWKRDKQDAPPDLESLFARSDILTRL